MKNLNAMSVVELRVYATHLRGMIRVLQETVRKLSPPHPADHLAGEGLAVPDRDVDVHEVS